MRNNKMSNYKEEFTSSPDEDCFPDHIDISINDFDNLDGDHEFSAKYEEKKEDILKKLRKKDVYKKRILKFSIAACIVLIGTPVAINAATDGELFSRLWGSKGHRSVERHTEVIEAKGNDMTVEYPERDYIDVDEEKASELIGDIQLHEPYSYTTMDGTTITVTSMVSDGNAAVAEIILENQNGVQGFVYGDRENERRGAYFSKDACINISFGETDAKLYADIDNSTDVRIVCYAYIGMAYTTYEGKRSLPIVIIDYPYPRGVVFGEEGYEDYVIEDDHESTKTDRNYFLMDELLDKAIFCGDDGQIEISPISMKSKFNDSSHFDNIWSVRIKYKDGTEYDVLERSVRDHENDKLIDNTSYAVGDEFGDLYVFNRLVDVGEIDEIYINDMLFSFKE